jgi:trigger factor
MEADIPEVMFEDKAEELVSDFGYRVKSQGMDLDIYLQYMGMTRESFKESFMDRAKMEVKLRLALEKVAELENLEVSAEEIEALMEEFGLQYGMNVDQVKTMAGDETEGYFKEDALTKKAIDLIFENAKLVEKKEEAAEEAAE